MTHLSKNKTKLIARVRRLVGQLEAVERALDADAPCGDILNQVASIRGAITGLTAELIEEHVEEHVLNAGDEAARREGASELIDAVRTYLR
jgi:DNA-binding FrmR family transcriptional regulator